MDVDGRKEQDGWRRPRKGLWRRRWPNKKNVFLNSEEMKFFLFSMVDVDAIDLFSVEVDHPAFFYLVDSRRVDVRGRPFYSPFHHALKFQVKNHLKI